MMQATPSTSTHAGRRPISIAPCPPGSRLPDSSRPDHDDLVRHAAKIARRPDRPVRQDLVRRIRAELEAETYSTDDKLNLIADRILRDLSRM